MKLKLHFIHQHIKRYNGIPVVEDKPLGNPVEIEVSITMKEWTKLENALNADFRLERIEDTNIVLEGFDHC